jgi:hypothetical protein
MSHPSFSLIWKGKVHIKVEVFVWFIIHGRKSSSTKDFLVQRHLLHLIRRGICVLSVRSYIKCGSSFHALFSCLEIMESFYEMVEYPTVHT